MNSHLRVTLVQAELAWQAPATIRRALAAHFRGLAGPTIPLVGRVVANADAYDAMTSDRAYRRALPHEVAIGEIERCAGTQFDPELAVAFVRLLDAWPGHARAG